MATKANSGAFVDNLGKVYAIYTGGFFAFVILLAILEQLGVPNKFIGYGFVFLTITVYAVIGVLSRTQEAGEYYVAGRVVPAFYNKPKTLDDIVNHSVGRMLDLFDIDVGAARRWKTDE